MSTDDVYCGCYGVATISRLLRSIGLFCRISSVLYGSFAKETYDFKEPTSRIHPIATSRQRIPDTSIYMYIHSVCKRR